MSAAEPKKMRVGLSLSLSPEEIAELKTVAEVERRRHSEIAWWALRIGLQRIRQRQGESWWEELVEPELGRLLPFRKGPRA